MKNFEFGADMALINLKNNLNKYRLEHPFCFYFMFFYLSGLVLYIIIFIGFFADHSQPLTMNELGDFLAGTFSPIAFLFLYLGYRQNSKAIEIQAKELKDSVDEQRKLLELHRIEMKHKIFQHKPHFKANLSDFDLDVEMVQIGDDDYEPQQCGSFTFTILETVNSARDVKFTQPNKNYYVVATMLLEPTEELSKRFSYDEYNLHIIENDGIIENLSVQYFDIFGTEYTKNYEISISKNKYDYEDEARSKIVVSIKELIH